MKKAFDLGIRASHFLGMAGGEVREERDFFLGIKNGLISEVAKFRPSLKTASRRFLDGKTHALIPGFVNGHTHLPMALFRGVADDLSFHDWLFKRILPLERLLFQKLSFATA